MSGFYGPELDPATIEAAQGIGRDPSVLRVGEGMDRAAIIAKIKARQQTVDSMRNAKTDPELAALSQMELAPQADPHGGPTPPYTRRPKFDVQGPEEHIPDPHGGPTPRQPGGLTFTRKNAPGPPPKFEGFDRESAPRAPHDTGMQEGGPVVDWGKVPSKFAGFDRKNAPMPPQDTGTPSRPGDSLGLKNLLGGNVAHAESTGGGSPELPYADPHGGPGSTHISPETAQAARNLAGDKAAQNERIGARIEDGKAYSRQERAEAARQASLPTREQKLRQTQGMQDIAEGLGNIDFRGFGTSIRLSPQKGYKAEGLRSLAERQKAEMTPEERVTVENETGVRFPEGTYWEDAARLIPNVTRLQTAGIQSDDKQSRLDRQDDRFDATYSRVPDVDRRKLTDSQNTLDALDRIVQFKGKTSGETGPMVGRINQMLGRWGNTPAEVAQLQAELGSVLSTFGKTISGGTITPEEMSRLKQQVPQMINPGDTFDALLERFRTQIETDRKNTIQDLKRQKRDVSEWESPAGGGESYQGKVGDQTVGPDGKTYTIKVVNPDGSVEVE